MLGKGKIDEAYSAINTGIDLEMSWMNYVLLGKVYEMKGQNREAADAYLTAFNLRLAKTPCTGLKTEYSRPPSPA